MNHVTMRCFGETIAAGRLKIVPRKGEQVESPDGKLWVVDNVRHFVG